MSCKHAINSKCIRGSGKKSKKCCMCKTSQLAPGVVNSDYSFLIEGTLRHQGNLLIAKSKYGVTFTGKLIFTKYFGDDEDFLTLVCSDDIKLVLGKPRNPHYFTDPEYKIELIDTNIMGLLRINISQLNAQVPGTHTYLQPQSMSQLSPA